MVSQRRRYLDKDNKYFGKSKGVNLWVSKGH